MKVVSNLLCLVAIVPSYATAGTNSKTKAIRGALTTETHANQTAPVVPQHMRDVTLLPDENLGKQCTAGQEAKTCGTELVCRQGVCSHCQTDRECPLLHQCVKEGGFFSKCSFIQQKAWEAAVTDPWEGLCTILVFLVSIIVTSAGSGGGPVFVPLLATFSRIKDAAAVPLAQCMILAGSLVNLSVLLRRRHPDHPEKPLVDFDCVVLLEPLLCLGVTTGVLVNQASPYWMMLVLLCVALGLGLWRTSAKWLRQRQAELESEALSPTAGGAEPEVVVKVAEVVSDLTNKRNQVTGLTFVWILMAGASFHGLPVCSFEFKVFFGVLAAMLLSFSFAASHFIVGASPVEQRVPFNWIGETLLDSIRYPLFGYGAGFLGGLLGAGGGTILGPVLIEVGLHAEAVQATTALFVFLSSSIATIQFAVLGQQIWHYSLWYSGVTLCGTVVGQIFCEYFVRQRRRYSLVTLAITLTLLASMVALAVVGVHRVLEDFRNGRQMWFSSDRLCDKELIYSAQLDPVKFE